MAMQRIKECDLELEDKVVGRGYFGFVKKGIFKNGKKEIAVAVKLIHTSKMHLDLVDEEALMQHQFEHKNVVMVFGVCEMGKMNGIVMEFMKLGSLDAYVRERADDYQDKEEKIDLIEFCLDVAKGMAFIEKATYYHGDLAARNVLVGRHKGDVIAKVSDFGLPSYPGDYLTMDRDAPFRWSAPEIILDNAGPNLASDVYSYGVLMWEVIALGAKPWGLVTNKYIAEVIRDQMMKAPKKCPDNMYELMVECWASDPTARPSFKVLKKKLNKILDDLEGSESESSEKSGSDDDASDSE